MYFSCVKRKKISLNFVLSSTKKSFIFNDIIDYFRQYISSNFKIYSSENSLEGMNLYYYFRPHLEVFIKPNSVATVHHDLKDNGHDNESFLKSYQKIKKLICLNSLQKIQLKNYNFKGLEIIPHGYYPKLNSFKIINKTHRKKITLGFFSRRYPRKVKGEDLLFKIASCLNTNLYRFILVGQKRSIEYKILIDMGFECELYEFIQYKKFIKLYSRLSFLLILSQYEGGPASLPEAIASYTPVITTKVGMCIDYIKHGVNGYFIDNSVNNIISLFANIEQDYFSQRNIFNSTYLYNQNNMPLTWKAVVQQYSDIFYSML